MSLAASLLASLTPEALLFPQLVLIVGQPSGGSSAALADVSAKRGWPLINVSFVLSHRMLDLATRQRRLQAARILDDLVSERHAPVVLLDHLEVLFLKQLAIDPLLALRRMAAHRTLVAAWPGTADGEALVHAEPAHPEYRRYDKPGATVIHAGTHSHPTEADSPCQDPHP